MVVTTIPLIMVHYGHQPFQEPTMLPYGHQILMVQQTWIKAMILPTPHSMSMIILSSEFRC